MPFELKSLSRELGRAQVGVECTLQSSVQQEPGHRQAGQEAREGVAWLLSLAWPWVKSLPYIRLMATACDRLKLLSVTQRP